MALFIETKMSFIGSFYKIFFGQSSDEVVEALHKDLQIYEDALKSDQFFLSDSLGTSSPTFLDIMVFPHIERLHAFKGTIWKVGDVDKFTNLWRWYD